MATCAPSANEKSGCSKTDATVATGNKSLLACELHYASFLHDGRQNMMPVMRNGGAFRTRVCHPDDVERVRDERQKALARGQPF